MKGNETIPHLILDRAKEFGAQTALLSYQGNTVKSTSFEEFDSAIKNLSLGLISIGIGAKENIAIISENRHEWIISELAILSIGASAVPIYTTLTPKEIEFILNDCKARAVIVSNETLLKKIISIKGLLPNLKNIILIDADTRYEKEAVKFSKILKLGEEFKDTNILENRKAGIKQDDTAVIIYTSGTTGRPKGVCLTHKNIVSNIKASLERIDIRQDDTYLSFLPLSHSFEHLVHLAVLHQGARIAYSKGLTSVAVDMKVFNPTIMIGVPFFFSRIKSKVMEAVEKGSWIKKRMFWWAYDKKSKLKSLPLQASSRGLKAKGLIDKFVFKKIRDKICPALRYFILGGAALPVDAAEFFWIIGIPIFEGYGLTETSPVVSVNTIKEVKIGTVGKPIPDVQVKIADDGEILIKGHNVMKGYLNMLEETSLIIRDGWFYTGDIGEIDKDGFIKITDRKKDIIINDLGKNVSPQKIEGILRADEFIKEVVVFGDKKPYLTALIVPDMEKLKNLPPDMAKLKNLPPHLSPLPQGERAGEGGDSDEEILSDTATHKFYEKRIKNLSKDLSRFEQIRRFALIPPLTSEGGELTPTLKVKRRVVENKYKEVLDRLYAETKD
ncbi:MAG: long-chain fatty acid--CoA ligase [Deltaproteobacteria bacterium]|nr:long-chain fatty acid--CoA ligase [Deltaproteobacteria bacterium]